MPPADGHSIRRSYSKSHRYGSQKATLVNLDLTVVEIAYNLNFEDTSYFTKFFKKQAGVTPKEFSEAEIKRVKRANSRLGSIS